ncbi:WD40-repeat-containing domain protein [Hypomontagnella submonticulosa]|nr:WD40-repeat-containing domain protein [Hypomontagnella submonticulosa]
MQKAPEAPDGGNSLRVALKSFFKKMSSVNKKSSQPERASSTSEAGERASHLTPTMGRVIPTFDEGPEARKPTNVVSATDSATKPSLDDNPEEHTSKYPQTPILDNAAQVPAHPSTDSQTSFHPSKEVTANTDASLSRATVFQAPTVPEKLWDRAYTANRRRHPRLVDQYETILSLDLETTAPDRRRSTETPNAEEFKNMIDQTESSSRKAQMKVLLESWLRDPDDDNDGVMEDKGIDMSEDNMDRFTLEGNMPAASDSVTPKKTSEAIDKPTNDQLAKSLRRILRQAVRTTPPEAGPAWVGACYASKILLHPSHSNRNDRDGLIHIISRMQWYSILPSLLKDQANRSTDLPLLLQAKILDLYTAILLYAIQLVCSHSGSMNWDFMAMSSSRIPALETIISAEKALPLFNEHWVKVPLQQVLQEAKEENGDSMDPEQKAESLPKSIRDLLNDLHITDPLLGLSMIPGERSRALHELYPLLLSSEHYRRFLDWRTPYSKILWITSDAGQGKSMLLSGIVRALLRPMQGEEQPRLSFFFFDYSRQESNNVAAALKNLIWLLIINYPSLSRHLEEKRESTQREYFDNPNDFLVLSSVFYSMIRDEEFPRTYFVVDALDESVGSDGQFGVDDFLSLITSSMSSSEKVRWLVSSNGSDKMVTAFQRHQTERLNPYTDIKGMSTVFDKYVYDKVEKISSEKNYDDELRAEAMKKLGELCRGNYLWVDIVCTELLAEDVWHVDNFLRRLQRIRDLDDLYSHMGNQIQKMPKDASLCNKVLKIMAVAEQSLHITELNYLVQLGRRVDLEKILQKCSVFLQVRDGIVSFQHQSARDYVRSHLFAPEFVSASHVALACRCLEYLATRLADKDDQRDNPKIAPVADGYSLLHWITHLFHLSNILGHSKIRDKTRWYMIIKKVQWFIDEHVLQWVDVLIREGQLTLAAAKLQKVDLCLQKKHTELREIHLVIRDVHLFLRLHQSISSSSETTVSNTVLFCPVESRIRKSWMAKAHPWVATSPLISQNWAHSFAEFRGHQDWIRAIAFSSDGRYIASGSDDSVVRIWDAEMGTTQHKVKVRRGWVYSIAFSSEGVVAAASNDYSITMWMASTGREVAHLTDLDGTPDSLCFSADGTTLAAVCSSEAYIWEAQLNTGFEKWNRVSNKSHHDSLQAITFSPNGNLLATGSYNSKVHIWDAGTDTQLLTFKRDDNSVINAVAFSSDSKLLASATDDGKVTIWDMNGPYPDNTEGKDEGINRRLHILEPGTGPIKSIAFSLDVERPRLAAATEYTIHVWDAKSGTVIQNLRSQSSNIRSIAFAPNGSYLASGSFDCNIHLWYASEEATDQELLDPRRGKDGVSDITLSPDNSTIAAVRGNSLFLWDVETKQDLQQTMEFDSNDCVTSIAFSPKGKYIIFAISDYHDARLLVYDVASMKCLHTFDSHHTDWVRGLAWSDDEEFVVSASNDYTAKIWKIGGPEVGKPIQVLESGHGESYVLCVAISPGGGYIVTGGSDDKLAVWERTEEKWDTTRKLIGHLWSVVDVLVTSDSKRVISCSYDKTVRIWDVVTTEEIQVIKVEWSIYKIWFPPQTKDYIMSYHGALSLSGESQPPAWSPWRLKEAGGRWWITLDDENALILPPEYEPNSACIIGDKIIITTSLSQLHVYQFLSDKLRQQRKKNT